jgi:alcohol dehydrogenase class IV
MDEFHYNSYDQEVIFGAGSLDQLGEAIGRFGRERLILCTNHSMRAPGHIDSVQAVLDERLVAVFDQVHPHVQDVQVNELVELAVEKKADAFIGMGGGSPIGMAKAASGMLAQRPMGPSKQSTPSIDQPVFPVFAIPTTYAGSEMTPVYGITHTHEDPPRKVTVNNPKIVPRLVIYDPKLTVDLPPEMTAATGMNALAHCIEALYSIKRNPLSTTVAVSGVRHVINSLFRCYEDGNDLEARTEMLVGSHLAGLSLASVTMGLHHGLCHVLGGSANVPHGIANSIILPHAIRFNADWVAPQLLPAGEAMGISTRGSSPLGVIEAMIQKISELVGQMHLPGRLRDAGVDLQQSDLPGLAWLGFQNRTVQNNPKPITDVSQIEKILRDAW